MSLEIPNSRAAFRDRSSVVCPYVPTALANAVVSVGGERQPLARAARDYGEASKGMRGRNRGA